MNERLLFIHDTTAFISHSGSFLHLTHDTCKIDATLHFSVTASTSSTKRGCDIGGHLGAMTHLGMISYQGPAVACDGRAQVTPGYKSGGQSD